MLRQTRVRHVATVIRHVSAIHRAPASKPGRKPKQVQSAATGNHTATFARSRALPWVGASLLAGGIAFYITQIVIVASKPCNNEEVADLSKQKDVSGRYNDTADSFDSEVGFLEIIMGINRIRKKLARQCNGHVLEVSCGTGRNLGYYDIGRKSSIESLTLVDLSPQMVEVCKKKWNILYGNDLKSDDSQRRQNIKQGMILRFLTGSALQPMPPAPDDKKYDTVIQTMGLCSTPSPKELLQNMTKHLNMSNPEARILLLEHGRSYRDWLNNILDGAAEKHAENYGCWFNRDIGALVQEAARKTGLRVVSERRHHFGTTWVFELRPDLELVKQISAAKTGPPEQPQELFQPSSWRSWFGFK